MFNLSNIGPRPGSKRPKRRVGRGPGSGYGTTAGRGTKGQKARSGGKVAPTFEGGQMPIYRRLPKRGFKNPFRKEYAIVNLRDLGDAAKGDVIDEGWLRERGRVPKDVGSGIKVLGEGEIEVAVTLRVNKVSGSAREKVESAGGTVELI